jgi:hypothetical protein
VARQGDAEPVLSWSSPTFRQDKGWVRQSGPAWAFVVLAAVFGVLVGVFLPRGSGTTNLPVAVAGQIVDPQLNLPDPAVLIGTSRDYLYTAGGGAGAPYLPIYPFRRINDLGKVVDGMPHPPAWSTDWIWPADIRKDGHQYVMWFTAIDQSDILSTGAQAKCIGLATSASPTGPYVPGNQPVICDPSGSIDPRTFVDTHGQLWLDWKSDDNATSPNVPTRIWAQRLASNGFTLLGEPTEIFDADKSWEQNLVESPDMVRVGGVDYLFFSGNTSFTPSSGIGVAICAGPAGPCHDPYQGPMLGSNREGAGPGEESVFVQNNAVWLLYSPSAIYGPNIYRQLAVARVSFAASGPYVSTSGGADPGFP